jgi:hypothetical protein
MTPQEDDELIARLLEHARVVEMPCLSAEAAARLTAMREELTEVRAERDALLEKPIDLAKMDSIDEELNDRMIAYYWHEQAQEARAELAAMREEIERKDERTADLELALDLALEWLGEMEPPDSRAISNEFVAMAAIRSEQDNLEECRAIIRAALTTDHKGAAS